MAAISFGVLFTCGLVYSTPPEESDEEEVNIDEEDENIEEEEEEVDDQSKEEYLKDLDNYLYFYPTIWKNKPLLVFFLSTYMLNFGYYVPYVHLVSEAQ